MADERKEKVIHTRIPAALEEQIKRLADSWRVPVSNVVRNMLEDALTTARRVRDAVTDTPSDVLDDVFGWQTLLLNKETTCARCGLALGSGEEAHLGLSDRPGPRVFCCTACLPRRKTHEPAAETRT